MDVFDVDKFSCVFGCVFQKMGLSCADISDKAGMFLIFNVLLKFLELIYAANQN